MWGKCRERICDGDIRATPTNQQQGHYIHVDCLPKPFDQLTLAAASDFAQNDLQTIMAKLSEPEVEDPALPIK
eukprot:10258958-Alexandrium_andersonii.AAC.1